MFVDIAHSLSLALAFSTSQLPFRGCLSVCLCLAVCLLSACANNSSDLVDPGLLRKEYPQAKWRIGLIPKAKSPTLDRSSRSGAASNTVGAAHVQEGWASVDL